jgi:hypothetical protein
VSDFDPIALADAQSDDIEISVSRDLASLVGFALSLGMQAAPDDAADQSLIDDAFDLADQLSNFGRTGIDHLDACYCIACGQVDEPIYHDPAVCQAAQVQS